MKPFKKGDPRINRSGHRTFDEARKIARHIADESITVTLGGKELEMTRLEAIFRQWASGKNPVLQQAFVTAACGKIPDEILINPQSTVTLKVKYVDGSDGDNGDGS